MRRSRDRLLLRGVLVGACARAGRNERTGTEPVARQHVAWSRPWAWHVVRIKAPPPGLGHAVARSHCPSHAARFSPPTPPPGNRRTRVSHAVAGVQRLMFLGSRAASPSLVNVRSPKRAIGHAWGTAATSL